MKYYVIEAEHIPYSIIETINAELEQLPGLTLMASGKDPIFSSQAVWVVACDLPLGERARCIVWEHNNGAWCRQVEIDFDTAESYC